MQPTHTSQHQIKSNTSFACHICSRRTANPPLHPTPFPPNHLSEQAQASTITGLSTSDVGFRTPDGPSSVKALGLWHKHMYVHMPTHTHTNRQPNYPSHKCQTESRKPVNVCGTHACCVHTIPSRSGSRTLAALIQE